MSGEWVSARAVAWVIHDAPVPADLAFTLTVIAARCDEHGRGSYQSTATIAEKTGKSPKQAQRDIVRLRELGLLLLGDQSITEHLPPGQRPVVYDVPLQMSGPKPVKESRNKAGVKKPPTPPTDGTPPIQGTPPTEGESTPPMDVPGPLPSMGAKQPLNNPLNNPSLSAAEWPGTIRWRHSAIRSGPVSVPPPCRSPRPRRPSRRTGRARTTSYPPAVRASGPYGRREITSARAARASPTRREPPGTVSSGPPASEPPQRSTQSRTGCAQGRSQQSIGGTSTPRHRVEE